MLDPESQQIRETFAFFGRAMYSAQCLERALAMCLAFQDEIGPFSAWDYDARLAENFRSTFGELVTRFNEISAKKHSALSAQLEQAVTDRNHLVHHYFWQRAVQFGSTAGRAEMLVELRELGNRFEVLDDNLNDLTQKNLERRGLEPQTLEALVETRLREYSAGAADPWDPKPVPKEIEVVAAYEWRVGTATDFNMIFASVEGTYLVLGERGLCFGPHDIPAHQLCIRSDIGTALPAKVHSRPKKSAPWNYAIPLARGHVLQVRSAYRDGKLRVRVRLRKP
jgi:hypothetical protein